MQLMTVKHYVLAK